MESMLFSVETGARVHPNDVITDLHGNEWYFRSFKLVTPPDVFEVSCDPANENTQQPRKFFPSMLKLLIVAKAEAPKAPPPEFNIGSTIDKLYAVREERLGIEKRAKEMKAEEVKLRGEIFEMLAALNLQRASGAVATAGIKTTTIPLVEDWDVLWQHIVSTGSTDLVQKRISVTAWRERFNEGEAVPGVNMVEDVDISLTKAAR